MDTVSQQKTGKFALLQGKSHRNGRLPPVGWL
jgi:hypothetical protein